LTGPVWLVGRTLRRDTIAAAAYGGDDNILDVIVNAPTGDVNAPTPGYNAAALAHVGLDTFTVLPSQLTAHLFRAPRLGTLAVSTETVGGIWA
jgi:hypothetical protein